MKQLVAQSSSGIPPGAKTSCLKALVYSAGLLPVEVEFDKQIRNVVKGGGKGRSLFAQILSAARRSSCQPRAFMGGLPSRIWQRMQRNVWSLT